MEEQFYEKIEMFFKNDYSPIRIVDAMERLGHDQFITKLTLYKKYNIPFESLDFDIGKLRKDQAKFRTELIKRYGGCVVSGLNADECEAAHIIPYAEYAVYDVDNGLLLNEIIHKSFDRYDWSINPNTHVVEILPKKKGKSMFIEKYDGKHVANLSEETLRYIREHYNKYTEKLIC